MTISGNSVSIILNLYKKDNISLDEATQLIEDLYKNKDSYIPVYPQWPQITYTEPPKWEVTCSHDTK